MIPLKEPAKPAAKEVWQLRLYVAGRTPRAAIAMGNLRQICRQHIGAKYRLRVIDVFEKPALAKADQIIAIPTLVRAFPKPVRRVLGDLSDLRRSLKSLDLCSTD